MLGSQNAISYVPVAYPVKKETGTQTDKEILPGMTRKDTGTGTSTDTGLYGTTQTQASKTAMEERAREGLLGGGTQSEASKTTMGVRKVIQEEKEKEKQEKAKEEEAKKNAVEPVEKPPFDLSQEVGRKELETYMEYALQRYGGDTGRMKGDEIKHDSEAFTMTLDAWKKLNLSISEFNRNDAKKFQQWANNTWKQIGAGVIEALAFAGKMYYPGAKDVIDKVKELAKKTIPNKLQDFKKSVEELQAKLFEGRPHWKLALDRVLRVAWPRLLEKYGEFTGDDNADSMPNPKRNYSAPAPEPVPEAPKKRKLKLAPEPAPEPKTYTPTKQGVKDYKADNPTASQRKIAEALGISKSTVLRYLK